MKAIKVAAELTAILRDIEWGTFDNPRYTYWNAAGRRRRGLLVMNPIATLAENGHWITVNYAPCRDEGKRLTLDQARRYLAWLKEGGNSPHWEFFLETCEPGWDH